MKAGASDYLMKGNLARLAPTIEREMREAANRRARQQAEKQVRLQATALQAAANAIIITDNQGTISWVNPAFTSLTGYTREEVLGQSTRILKSGQHDAAFYRTLWETILSGRVWHGEIINQRKDGSLYFEEQTITPVLNETGEIINFIAIKQDVTEHKRADAELRRSEAQYRRLIDTTFEGVWIFDAELRTTYVNQRLAEMLGVKAEEMTGRSALDFVAEDSRANVQQRLQRRTQGVKEQYDVHLRRNDGSDLWAIVCATPILNEHGAFTGSLSMLTDITARKRVEEERARLNLQLESERQRMDNIVANVPGVVWEAWGEPDAATQRIDFVSDYVEQMLGYSVEEWLETPNFWLTIVHPDDREQAGRRTAEDFARGQSSGPLEFRWVAKDGRVVWVEANYVVVKDDNGQSIGLRGITTDISEQKEAKEALRQSEGRYRLLFERNPQPMWVFDLETLSFLEINDLTLRSRRMN
ncbi:MAG: hypothetical protein DMF68_11210 [Acidobacteria bacterium]|nr:MAG: hypothetical protein DMF68_11210 [Acidobacteriota bacterium]